MLQYQQQTTCVFSIAFPTLFATGQLISSGFHYALIVPQSDANFGSCLSLFYIHCNINPLVARKSNSSVPPLQFLKLRIVNATFI